MSKSTKLLIAAIGLGGLGYFLYKKGLFSNKVADVATSLGLEVDKDIIDTGKKTAVEPPEEAIKVEKPFPSEPVVVDPIVNPIGQPTIIYPKDELYPIEQKIFTNPSENIYNQQVTYDQPAVIDYTSGKYNQDVTFDYLNKDIVNIRLNQYIYA